MSELGLTVIEINEPELEECFCARCGMKITKSSQIEIHLNWHQNNEI